MTDALWGVAGSIVAALIGGGWYLVRAQRRKIDAETRLTEADRRSKEVSTDITLAGAAFEMYEKVDKKFSEMEARFDQQAAKFAEQARNFAMQLLASQEDVKEAIKERHKCEDELQQVKDRLSTLERNQRERMKQEATP